MGWHDTEYDPRVDGYARDYGYRPSASDFAEEDFEDWRKQNFPRGYGPPWDGENDPDDPDLESLEESDDPERFLHPDDFTSSPSAEPWDTPIYHVRTPGADYPDETDPAEWEDREEERAHENLRGHFGAKADWEVQVIRKNEATDRNGDKHSLDWGGKGFSTGVVSSGLAPKCSCGWSASKAGSEAAGRRGFTEHIRSIQQKQASRQTPIGGILTQADQWPDRVAANRHAADHADCESEGFHHFYTNGECEDCGKEQPNWDGATDAKSPNEYFFQKHHGAFPRNPEREQRGNGLDMENYEFFHNKTPELGTTVPDSIGGDLPGTVNIRSRDETGPTDAFVMPAEESGLGYDAIVRHAPDGKGFDVLKPL